MQISKLRLTKEQETDMVRSTQKRLQNNIYLTLQNHPFYAVLQSNFTHKIEISEIGRAHV